MRCCDSGRTDITTVSSKRNWRQILPGLLVSAVFLVILFILIKPKDLIAALRLADYRLVALGVFVTLGWLLMRGVVWRNLLQEKATYSQVFFTLNEGYLLNNFLPFRLGELGRAFLLNRKAGLDFAYVLSTIVVERAFDILLAAGVFFSTLPFVVSAGVPWQTAILPGGLVIIGLLVLFLMARYPQWVTQIFDRLSQRWPLIQRLGGRLLPAFLSGLAVLTDSKRFLRVALFFLLNLSIAFLQYYLMMLAFFPKAPPLWAIFCLAASSLGMAAPSGPASIGVFEWTISFFLPLIALNQTDEFKAAAFAYALTLHLWNILVTGILGVYGLSRDGESLANLFKRLKATS